MAADEGQARVAARRLDHCTAPGPAASFVYLPLPRFALTQALLMRGPSFGFPIGGAVPAATGTRHEWQDGQQIVVTMCSSLGLAMLPYPRRRGQIANNTGRIAGQQ